MSDQPEDQKIPLSQIDKVPTFYANVCLVRSSPEEVILQFGQRDLQDPRIANGVVTVYTNLWHAKRLAHALLDSIEKYEAIFGKLPNDPIAALDPEKLKSLGVTDDDD